ncbi:MAG: GGDEF domain-containing protein [Clostridia bacterium]|nr:GGDEF domain-containing protein [Clostridia bacterium]
MRKLIIILCLFFSFSFVYADDLISEYIDKVEENSLTNEDLVQFKEMHNNESLELFLTAHLALIDYDYKTAYVSLERALELTENDALKIEILYYLARIDLLFYDYDSASQNGLALKKLAHESEDLTGVVRADEILAIAYLDTYDASEAEKYATEARNLSSSIGYDIGEWHYLNIMGSIELYNGNYLKAQEIFEKAEQYSETTNMNSIFENTEIINQMNVAKALYMQNRQYQAIDLLKPLLSLVDEENDLLRSKILYYMGHYGVGNHPISIPYLFEAKQTYESVSLNEEFPMFLNYINEDLAYAYYISGEYHKAADLYYKMNQYYNSNDYYYALRDSYEDLGKYKFDEVTEQVQLLEQLAAAKSAELSAQKKLLFFIVGTVVLLVILSIISVVVYNYRKKIKKDLYINSITDSLTEVYNRTRIIEIFKSKLEGNNAVILLDVDNLKEINDRYGYTVGDQVLKNIADTLKHTVRGDDVVGRYGGGEFLIILDYASQQECLMVAERVRLSVENIQWDYKDLKSTCSVGVTRVYSKDPDEILQYVDTLLNQAKDNGRNQVVYG